MTFVISYWVIPTVVTIALWLWALLTPAKPTTGGYLYLPDFMPLVRCVAAIVGTLASWLVYFMILALHH